MEDGSVAGHVVGATGDLAFVRHPDVAYILDHRGRLKKLSTNGAFDEVLFTDIQSYDIAPGGQAITVRTSGGTHVLEVERGAPIKAACAPWYRNTDNTCGGLEFGGRRPLVRISGCHRGHVGSVPEPRVLSFTGQCEYVLFDYDGQIFIADLISGRIGHLAAGDLILSQ